MTRDPHSDRASRKPGWDRFAPTRAAFATRRTRPPSPDGRTHNVSSVVTATTATNTIAPNARAIKVIVVTVADATGKNWVTERSTFEALSG